MHTLLFNFLQQLQETHHSRLSHSELKQQRVKYKCGSNGHKVNRYVEGVGLIGTHIRTYVGRYSYNSGQLLEAGRAFQITEAAVVVNFGFKMEVSIAVRFMHEFSSGQRCVVRIMNNGLP